MNAGISLGICNDILSEEEQRLIQSAATLASQFCFVWAAETRHLAGYGGCDDYFFIYYPGFNSDHD